MNVVEFRVPPRGRIAFAYLPLKLVLERKERGKIREGERRRKERNVYSAPADLVADL